MLIQARRLSMSRHSVIHLLLGVALSSVLGVAGYHATARLVDGNAEERFLRAARAAHGTLLGRVKTYVGVLHGAAGLFHMNPQPAPGAFYAYVEGLRLDRAALGIETINFARHVTETERPAFEQWLQEQYAETIARPMRVSPPGPRAEYLALAYIAPQATSMLDRLGVDLSWRAGVASAVRFTRENGGVGASGIPINLKNNSKGLGMRLGVYRRGMPVATRAQRRAAFIGSVGIGFSVEGLMRGIIAELPFDSMRVQLIGLAPGGGSNERRHILLYDTAALARAKVQTAGSDHFQITLPIQFSQRNWEAHFSIGKAALYDGIDVHAPWLALAFGFLGTALLYALIYSLSTSPRHALGLAEDMTRELRQLGAHADQIKEDERKRIAREIHDDLGQNLLALRIDAHLLSSRTGARHPRLHARARHTLDQIDSTIKSVRQIINDLRPNVLDLGLNAAVDWQLAEFQRSTGIACVLAESGMEIAVNDRCATALFRILQESLSNICRHAGATRVRVDLAMAGGCVTMTVADNGVGLDPGMRLKQRAFGLVGIEERVKILGGQVVLGNHPGGGMRVHVTVPLSDAVTLPGVGADHGDEQLALALDQS